MAIDPGSAALICQSLLVQGMDDICRRSNVVTRKDISDAIRQTRLALHLREHVGKLAGIADLEDPLARGRWKHVLGAST